MRAFGLWVLFLAVVLATDTFIPFTSSLSISNPFLPAPDMELPGYENNAAAMIHNRKLMGSYNPSKEQNKKGTDNINVDDYNPIDPVPSSKAAIKTGPIEHGTPLIPYIPKPSSPPSNPKHDGAPSPP